MLHGVLLLDRNISFVQLLIELLLERWALVNVHLSGVLVNHLDAVRSMVLSNSVGSALYLR